jgi:hypothetical protein
LPMSKAASLPLCGVGPRPRHASQEVEAKIMAMCRTELHELGGVPCKSCGHPPKLWCEDCGCSVSCHDFIYPRGDERVPYCLWDFGPCPKEQRPVFLAAMEDWLRDMRQHMRRRSQAA